MLDFNNILSTPGVDVQYFTGQGGYFGNITSVVLNANNTPVTIADTAGTLTVNNAFWLVGQAITISGTLTAGTINGTANYTTPVTFYIIAVNRQTSIQISATLGGSPVTSTTGTATPGGTFSVNGVLTVTAVAGGYQAGQAITVSGTLSAGTISGTANYTTPSTFYIVGQRTATSIIISATPNGTPVLSTAGTATTGGVFTLQSQAWQTWRKPRGVKNVYMIGVGGGSSGASGSNLNTSSAGAAGGGSGAQTCVWIPAMLVPDILYVHPGAGGKFYTSFESSGGQQGGGPTYVTIEPSTTLTANMTLLAANGGVSAAVTGGSGVILSSMPLASRGYFTSFTGQSGFAAGGGGGAGTAITPPTTGLMVTGGAGSGGSGATAGQGGGFNAPTGIPFNDFFPTAQTGGTAASGATPAGAGFSGPIMKNFIMNYGGAGGGGSSTTSGGLAGAGGNGAPGCGGGGAGGSTNTVGATTLPRPGNGGDGFVIIMSW